MSLEPDPAAIRRAPRAHPPPGASRSAAPALRPAATHRQSGSAALRVSDWRRGSAGHAVSGRQSRARARRPASVRVAAWPRRSPPAHPQSEAAARSRWPGGEPGQGVTSLPGHLRIAAARAVAPRCPSHRKARPRGPAAGNRLTPTSYRRLAGNQRNSRRARRQSVGPGPSAALASDPPANFQGTP